MEPDVAGSSPVVHPNRDSTIIRRARFDIAELRAVDTRIGSEARETPLSERPWITIVWNDPVNLMSYVSYVFRSYFGFDRATAERLMLQVHHEGRAVVASGPREEMERHVEAMHDYGLWATLERQPS